jgi:hypothetical protein
MKKVFSFILPLAMLLTIITFTACSGASDSDDSTETSDPLAKPSFKVETEIPIFDGSILQFSKKPVRAQWNIGDSPFDIAFVFPKNTKIAQKINGEFILIKASSEYQVANRIFPFKEYGVLRYELTLTNEMGKEAFGIRIVSSNMGRGLLPIYIDGVTERAVKPEDSIIYVSDIDPSKPKPTDDKTLAKFRLPSRDVNSDNAEIASLAKTITNGINKDYEKAKAIHQWVAGNIWYNNDWLNGIGDNDAVMLKGEDTWTSTYVLRNKRGVCDGYANLTAALLRAVGIPAKRIEGFTGSNVFESHGWVEAYADSRWINIDSTWDSKNVYENGKFSPKQASGNRWFDVPDKEFSKNHKITNYAEYILKNGLAATDVP